MARTSRGMSAPRRVSLRCNIRGIPCVMVSDLEAEEFMNRFQGLRIGRFDLYHATGRDFFKRV